MRLWRTVRGLGQAMGQLLQGTSLRDQSITTARPEQGLTVHSCLRASGRIDEWVRIHAVARPEREAVLARHRERLAAAMLARKAVLQALAVAPAAAVALALAAWLAMELMLSELAAAWAAAQALWAGGMPDPALWTHLATMAWGWLRPLVDAWLMARAVRWLKGAVARWVGRRIQRELGLLPAS